MIQPLNFCSNIDKENKLYSQFNRKTATPSVAKSDVADVKVQKEPFFKRVKNGTINLIKGFNSTTSMIGGAVKGLMNGALTIAGVGIVAKNVKESKSNIWGSLKGIIKDTFICAKKVACAVPSVITKSPVDNVKSLSRVPKEFYKNYMANNKTLAVGATVAGLAVLGFNLLAAKINANKKNADVDHKFNSGHTA